MPEPLHCPACPGTPALPERRSIAEQYPGPELRPIPELGSIPELRSVLELDGLHRCRACQGVLADHAAVARAKQHFGPSHPVLRARQVSHRCRVCGGGAAVGVPRCEQCSASLLLRCPRCTRSMAVVEVDVAGIVVDVCGACELTFFDAGELAFACRSPRAFLHALRQPASVPARAGAADVAVEVAMFAPVETLEAVAHGAHAAGHIAVTAAGHVAHAARHVDVVAVVETSGAAALGAADTASEAAGAAAETILEVLAALFD
jgi:hypothetical protein